MNRSSDGKSPDFQSLETLATVSFVLLLISLWTRNAAWLAAAATLLGIALFIRPLAARLAKGWLAFGAALGRINTAVILTVIFVLVLTPIAWVQRRFKGDFLGLKRKVGGARVSYWVRREHLYAAKDFENLW